MAMIIRLLANLLGLLDTAEKAVANKLPGAEEAVLAARIAFGAFDLHCRGGRPFPAEPAGEHAALLEREGERVARLLAAAVAAGIIPPLDAPERRAAEVRRELYLSRTQGGVGRGLRRHLSRGSRSVDPDPDVVGYLGSRRQGR